jgi:hypothetical protein
MRRCAGWRAGGPERVAGDDEQVVFGRVDLADGHVHLGAVVVRDGLAGGAWREGYFYSRSLVGTGKAHLPGVREGGSPGVPGLPRGAVGERQRTATSVLPMRSAQGPPVWLRVLCGRDVVVFRPCRGVSAARRLTGTAFSSPRRSVAFATPARPSALRVRDRQMSCRDGVARLHDR